MSFPFLFKLTLYGLTLDALVALYLTDIVTGPALVAVGATMLASWWVDRLHPFIPNFRKLWNLITIAFLVYAVLDLALLAESFMAAVTHLLLFLLTYKLYNARHHRDLLDIFLLTFLMLVSSCLFTTSFGFLLVFCLYIVLGVWGFMLFHLRREADLAMPEQSRAALAAPGFITSSLLYSSLGVVLTALILTLSIFFLMPRLGRTFLSLQGQVGSLSTGFTDRVELGIYGAIQKDPTIVMRVSFADEVRAPERLPHIRWRGVAFDQFDGRAWTLSERARSPIRRVRDGHAFQASSIVGVPFLSYEVVLEPTGTATLFGLHHVTAILGRLPEVTADGADGLALPAPPAGPVRYLATSQQERAPDAWRRQTVRAADYPQKIRDTYLQLPAITPRVQALALTLAAGSARPLEIARSVESYLSDNLRYDLDLGTDSGLDPIDDFLFERKSGNCEYFAAAMAILLRAAGVPARVVNGFQRGEWNDVGRFFAVRQRDAHSWVEVFTPGAGWVTFDPSPRAAFEAQAFGPSGRLAQHLDALRMRWHRYVVDYNVGDQALVATKLRTQSALLRGRLTIAWTSWSFAARRSLRTFWRNYGSAALLLAGLLGTLWVLGRRTKTGQMMASWLLRTRDRRTVSFYDRMLVILARRGWSLSPAVTPRELLASLLGRPQMHQTAAELIALYERVRFGGEMLTSADGARANLLLRELERAAK
jgi:hypothetical protein